jgi:hypothetical protein
MGVEAVVARGPVRDGRAQYGLEIKNTKGWKRLRAVPGCSRPTSQLAVTPEDESNQNYGILMTTCPNTTRSFWRSHCERIWGLRIACIGYVFDRSLAVFVRLEGEACLV